MPSPAPALPALYCPKSQRVAVSPAALASVTALYDQGRFTDAYAAAVAVAPLHCWAGSAARLLASRLAARLQGQRLSSVLSLTAWRESRRDASTCLFHGYWLWARRGPLATWEFTRDWRCFSNLDDHLRADFLLLRARVAGQYRDFATAWPMADEAAQLDPGSPWTWCERAGIHLCEDRVEEAEQAVTKGRAINPWHCPSVQVNAAILMRQNRVEEAAELLRQAGEHVQCPDIVAQRIGILRELDDPQGMIDLLAEYESLALLLEPEDREWLAVRRCDAYCLEGTWDKAAEQADLVRGPYSEMLARKLRSAGLVSRRIRLAPPRIIQKHNTCGPSTLAMLARYWHHPTSDDAINEAIAYDGTCDRLERQWCLDQGFHAREFRLTWDAGRALLDAGIPFAVATVEVSSAHMQAFVGYDELRESFLIQDPSSLLFREVLAKTFLEEYALHGPRGLVLVPESQRAALDAIALPDAGLFDRLFQLRTALFRHDRASAEEQLTQMRQEAPDHPRSWWAKLELAGYDGSLFDENEAIQALARLFPDDPRLCAQRARALRELGHRDDVIAFLRKTARAERTHPTIWRDLALALGGPVSDEIESWSWLRKAHAAMPFDAGVVEAWGHRQWNLGEQQAAVETYGFASSFAPGNEHLAQTWFDAAHMIGRREDALERLRERNRTLGRKSAQPSRTLLWMLDRYYLDDEAAAVLAKALECHPDDGLLCLDAVWLASRQGNQDLAEEQLARAKKHCTSGAWLYAKAQLHERFGEHRQALATWKEIADKEPTSIRVHEAVASLLAVVEGEAQARTHLEAVVKRFPHHLGLQQILVEWLRRAPLDETEAAARTMRRLHPNYDWAARELAVILERQGRFPDALVEVQQALDLNPRAASAHGIQASILQSLGRAEEARQAFRKALTLDVDYTFAIHGLLDGARDAQQRRQELDFVHSEMIRQVLQGSAIGAYHERAFPLLEPGVLLGQLQEIHRARPDLYDAWVALIDHLLDLGQREEARQLAEEATRRFARLPGAWLTLARIHRSKPDWPGVLQCARTACQANPDWPVGWYTLADALEDSGDAEQAIDVLNRAIRRIPGAANLATLRASILWRTGRRQEALSSILATLVRFPKQESAWAWADSWADALGKQDELLAAVHRLVHARPGEADSWLILARCLPRAAMEEKLAAVDKALGRDPRNLDAHDLKASLLAGQARYSEAKAACRPACFGDDPPHPLKGRALWIDFQQGKKADALASMESLLLAHPDYLWGWQVILEWASELEKDSVAKKARAAIARLAPDSLQTVCSTAASELMNGNTEQALALYQQALARFPASGEPLFRCLALLWDRRNLRQLRELAAKALPGVTEAVAQLYLMLVDASEGKRSSAKRRMKFAIRSPEAVDFVLDDLDRELREIGWGKRWHKALTRSVRQRTLGMAFATLWVKTETSFGRWTAWKHFPDWIARGNEDAAPAVNTFFVMLAKQRAARKALGLLKSPARKWVRERTFLFGQFGYALASAGLWKKTIEWSQDVLGREDLEVWMATNLMLAYSQLGREEDASRVAEGVYRRDLRGSAFPCVIAQRAYALAIAGKAAEARATLAESSTEEKALAWTWKATLARELAAVLSLEGASAVRRQKEAIKNLREYAAAHTKKPDATMARLHRQTLRAMRRHTGRTIWPWDFRLVGVFPPLRSLFG